MSQLSFFSADLTPPHRDDLGGLLAAHGQLVRAASGVRLSILLDAEWRALALRRELRVRDVESDITRVDDGDWLLASERTIELNDLQREWVRGAVKSVPSDLRADVGFLRCWVLAAGRVATVGSTDPAGPGGGGPDSGSGYLLGLDSRAEGTHEPLAALLSRTGVTAALVGVRAGGPALRVLGRRRVGRLAEMVGTPPPEAPSEAFPPPAH